MFESKQEWMFPTLLSAFVSLFVLSANSTLDSHEVLVAQTAREMISSGDYIHPTFAGEPRLQKPPLAYWLCAASFWCEGEQSERAARLPSVFATTLGVALTSIFARRAFGTGMGFLAGSIQATCIWTLSFGRLAIVDSILTTLVSAAILVSCWDRQSKERNESRKPTDGCPWVWLLTPLFWFLCGLIVLAKGPVGLAMLLPPVIIYRWMRGRRKTDAPLLFHRSAILGIALFLVLSLAWPIAMLQRYPEAWQVWTGQSFGRFQEHWGPQTRPWWYFFVQTPWLLFPWSLPLVVVAWRRPRIDWREQNRLLVLMWFATAFVLCSVSAGKRAHYIMPGLPAACVMAALAVRRLLAEWYSRRVPSVSAGSFRSVEGTPLRLVTSPPPPQGGRNFWRVELVPYLVLLLAIVETIVVAGFVAPGQDLTGFREMVERNKERFQEAPLVQIGSRERATVFPINRPIQWLQTPPVSVSKTTLVLTPEKNLPELLATGRAKVIDHAGPKLSREERKSAFALVELAPLR